MLYKSKSHAHLLREQIGNPENTKRYVRYVYIYVCFFQQITRISNKCEEILQIHKRVIDQDTPSPSQKQNTWIGTSENRMSEWPMTYESVSYLNVMEI